MGKVLKIVAGVVVLLVVLAAIGWVTLRRPDISFAELERRYANPQSKFVDLPGGLHVHYRDQGDPKGPTILLVHGFYMSLDTWEPWVKALGPDFRVVTLDLPGFGLTRAPKGYKAGVKSYVRLIDAFAKARGLDHFALGGSSMGGDVAWRYALAHPEHLKALILVDSAGWPGPPGAGPHGMSLAKSSAGRMLVRDLDASSQVRKGFESAYANPALATNAMVKRHGDLGRAPGHRDVMLDLLLDFEKRGSATAAKLAAIKTPTLILWGAKDALIAPADGEKFHDAISGSKLIVYPNAGHVVEEESAGSSAADVRAFLLGIGPKKVAVTVRKPAHEAAAHRDPGAVVFY